MAAPAGAEILLLYRLLANLVLIIHLGFVLWVVLGCVVVWRCPWAARLHIPAVAWGAYIEFSGAICPLTTLEIEYRERGGQAGYSGGFIDHYITGCLYPDGLTRSMQVALGLVLLTLNAIVYWRVLRQQRN